jgi:hypothetical protein
MVVTGDRDEVLRLAAVIEHQRRLLDQARAAAAGDSVIAMARGALMERLGLSAAEAAGQLAELPAATGVPIAEMAAAVLAHGAPADDRPPLAAPEGFGASREPGQAGARSSGLGSLLAQAAAELAADGAELADTMARPVLGPLGAGAVMLWLLDTPSVSGLFNLGPAAGR